MRPEIVILLGGSAAGRELTLQASDGSGPETINVPDMIDEHFHVLVYRKQRCMGWPSRDDQGRIQYMIEEKRDCQCSQT